MNLIIDVGNTLIKYAVFEEDQLKENHISTFQNALEALNALFVAFPQLSTGIISSTAQLPADVYKIVSEKLLLIEFSHLSKLNFTNAYKTQNTLGLDRIALVAAASHVYPHQPVLVIDAGTCITYDFIDKNSVYHGGAISPGVQMRFKAMNSFADQLPLLSASKKVETYMGTSTEEAMQIGVIKSICYEIDGYIQDYHSDYEDLTVVLTGGDYKLLSASIKNSIFATHNFLLRGLNKILQLNSI